MMFRLMLKSDIGIFEHAFVFGVRVCLVCDNPEIERVRLVIKVNATTVASLP